MILAHILYISYIPRVLRIPNGSSQCAYAITLMLAAGRGVAVLQVLLPAEPAFEICPVSGGGSSSVSIIGAGRFLLLFLPLVQLVSYVCELCLLLKAFAIMISRASDK